MIIPSPFSNVTREHAPDRDCVGKILLELANSVFEEQQDGIGIGLLPAGLIGIDIFAQRRFPGLGRPVGQDNCVTTLEVSLLTLEMRPPLGVDRPRHSVGETAAVLGRVVGRRNTYGLDLDHPTGSQSGQDRVDLAR
jgi:hypothetical protein